MAYNPNSNNPFTENSPGLMPAPGSGGIKTIRENGSWTTLSPSSDVYKYVNTGGNDTTGDGSSSAPYYSIQKAIDDFLLMDTTGNYNFFISVAPGTYTYSSTINIIGMRNPLTIYTSDTTTINIDMSVLPKSLSWPEDNAVDGRTVAGFWFYPGAINIISSRVTIRTIPNSPEKPLSIVNTMADGSSAATHNGVSVYNGILDHLGDSLVLSGWNGLFSMAGSKVYLSKIEVDETSAYSPYYGLHCEYNSYIKVATSGVINNCNIGVYASLHSLISLGSMTYSGNSTNFSPALNTEGNYFSEIIG